MIKETNEKINERANNYVLMCSKSKEIQDLWEPKKGDNCHHGFLPGGAYWFNIINSEVQTAKANKDYMIWLPRIEDYMKIFKISEERIHLFGTFWAIACHVCGMENKKYYMDNFDSLEQIFLGFFMDSDHNKRWNKEKEDWILEIK